MCLWAESKTACMMMGRAGMAGSAVRESQPQHDYYCGEDGDLKVIRVAGVSQCHPSTDSQSSPNIVSASHKFKPNKI